MRGKNGAIGGDGGNGANLTIKFKGNAAFIKLMQKNISYSIEGRLGSSPRNSGEAGTGGKGDISKGGQGGYRGKNDLGGTPGHGGNGFIWI